VRTPSHRQARLPDGRHEAWNHDVLSAPLAILEGRIRTPSNPILAGFPNPAFAPLAETSVRGATAVTALIDAESKVLYVANLGDSRAVAGWWDPISETWRCDVLTNEHQGGNPAEVARYVGDEGHTLTN